MTYIVLITIPIILGTVIFAVIAHRDIRKQKPKTFFDEMLEEVTEFCGYRQTTYGALLLNFNGVTIRGKLHRGTRSNGIYGIKLLIIDDIDVDDGANIVEFEQDLNNTTKVFAKYGIDIEYESYEQRKLDNLFKDIDNFQRLKVLK